MLQIVRRKNTALAQSVAAPGAPFPSRKERHLKIAFVSLAASNLFVISTAVSFYLLVYRS